MSLRNVFGTSLLVLSSALLASAYAATVNNPGVISFSANVDSHIYSGTGLYMYTQNSSIIGSLDSAGVSFFDQSDISFDAFQDTNGWTTQLQAIDDGYGSYCPNSDDATISLKARIKVTRIAGTSIATTPCYISIDSGNYFELTTKTSGSLTGADFNETEPKLVATVALGSVVTGTCSAGQKDDIHDYYGLGTTAGTTTIELFDASVSPTNFTGSGC